MMRKITGVALSAMLLALCSSAEAQQQAKVAKIGWLGASSLSGPGSGFGLFRREFNKIGYVEGKNVTFEHRFADDKLELLPALVDELVRVKVDVILTASTSGAQAAKNATRTIPIVFLNASDPVAAGLVDSLARPGGNITGLTNLAPDLGGKRLELLKEIIPKLSRVAVLWNPQEAGSAQQWNESQLPARELSLTLYSMEVSSNDKYESAFKEATKARSRALAVTQHILASSNRKQIVELATKNRLPAIWPRGDYVASGGLISYGPDREETFTRAASMVDKILKGTKPADIPVEQPRKFELVINLKTAKQIGLTIPPNVLARADKVIR